MCNSLKNVLNDIKNVQVYPAKKRVELNDKATKRFFNLTRESYQKLLETKAKATLVEKKNHKKFGTIKSSFSISNEKGFSNFIPLDEHDRAVLSGCVSNWLEGNRYITPAIIYRGLTGKVNDASGNFQSIDRLMFTAYDSQILDTYEKLEYIKLEYIDGDDKIVMKKSVVLPCYRVEVTINGQTSDVICFDRKSPFLTQASLKKQMLTYDAELLDVPHQQNTPINIAAKNYVMRRIQEIKLHKMTPTITFYRRYRSERRGEPLTLLLDAKASNFSASTVGIIGIEHRSSSCNSKVHEKKWTSKNKKVVGSNLLIPDFHQQLSFVLLFQSCRVRFFEPDTS